MRLCMLGTNNMKLKRETSSRDPEDEPIEMVWGRPASDPGAAVRVEAEPMERSAVSQLATATRRSLQPPSWTPHFNWLEKREGFVY